MKIDIFTHANPKKYSNALRKLSSSLNIPIAEPQIKEPEALFDPVIRIEIMDELGIFANVITLGQPPVEKIAGPEKAADLARIANDALADFVSARPERLFAAASLPMNNIDAALKELDRAVNELRFRGIQVYSSVNGKPLDSPEFMPVYEMMSKYDLPVWIHPLKDSSEPDYPGEEGSMYNLNTIIGWPHETTKAVMRIAASGVMERFPNLKIITHHSGGTIPYLAKRIEEAPFKFRNLTRPIADSLRMFYFDTAVQGNTPNLMCAYAFGGSGHMLFGTDFPMTSPEIIKKTIKSVENMDIPAGEKDKIFRENARLLLKLKA